MRKFYTFVIKIDSKEMSQYSFSYNYDSLNDAFNAVNRKGKMQKRYLSPEYLASAQEYRDMRKELNEILRKKTTERTEEEAGFLLLSIHLHRLLQVVNKACFKSILTEYLQIFCQVVFVSTLRQMPQKIHRSQFTLLELQRKNFSQCKSFAEM